MRLRRRRAREALRASSGHGLVVPDRQAGEQRLEALLDQFLDAASWDDYGPNGLQVPGAEEVSIVATGVSAHRELFERAAAAGAQLVLCHHGLFWRNQPRHVDPKMKERLKVLFDSDM